MAALPFQHASAWAARLLVAVGVDADAASLTAGWLVTADARGYPTHGLSRLPTYVDKLTQGEVNPRACPVWRRQHDTFILEADGGLGQVAAALAVEVALAEASHRAVTTVFIRDAGHLGALGPYLVPLARAGLIGWLAQVTQPVMSPGEGVGTPVIGNNPQAFAAPNPHGEPIVFDMAASVIARGNLLMAAQAGDDIPPGVAVDRDGRPTTDAKAAVAGAVLPAGGHKGLGLAMLVELLAGSLTGAAASLSSSTVAAGHAGAVLIVFNPALIIGPAVFEAHLTAWTARLIAAGGRLPGSRAAQAEKRARAAGITLAPATAAALIALGESRGVPFPSTEEAVA